MENIFEELDAEGGARVHQVLEGDLERDVPAVGRAVPGDRDVRLTVVPARRAVDRIDGVAIGQLEDFEDSLDTSELAELLRIKERKVYEMAASGKIPCTRATGKLLFPRKEVESWLEGKASQAFAANQVQGFGEETAVGGRQHFGSALGKIRHRLTP